MRKSTNVLLAIASFVLPLLLLATPWASAQENQGEQAATPKGEDADEGGYSGYKDSEGRGEKYWTEAMAGARGKVATLRDELDRLDTTTEALRNQFYARDDPYQREKVKAAWDDQLNRRATMRAELEKAEKGLDELNAEAHRAGALPGWLRQSGAQERASEEQQKDVQRAPTYKVDLDKLGEDNKAADEKIFGKPEEGQGEGGEKAAGGEEGKSEEGSEESGGAS